MFTQSATQRVVFEEISQLVKSALQIIVIYGYGHRWPDHMKCTETLLAAKDAEHSGDTRDLVYETADLWFHSLVMLSRLGLGPKDILDELASRFDLSGLEEKASRNP